MINFSSKPSSINPEATRSSLNLSAPMILLSSNNEFYYYNRLVPVEALHVKHDQKEPK